MNSIRANLVSIIKNAMETNDHEGTWRVPLGKIGQNRWAIVVAWMDYDDNDKWRLYGKVAYQPVNSIMQCDYDIDWCYPTNDEGECDDTEISISDESDIDWLIGEWDRVRNTIEEGVYVL